jgi:Rrf2 family protein
MLSQKTRYALKALLELAALPAAATLPAAAIAARRAIPVKFLESILAEMKHGGLVRGRRGRSGGYRLARGAEEISFGNVVRLMEGPLALLPCVSVTQYQRCADCTAARSCELQQIFRLLRDSTATLLDGWSLADARGKARRRTPRKGAAKSRVIGRT